jgi:hypothetical protein
MGDGSPDRPNVDGTHGRRAERAGARLWSWHATGLSKIVRGSRFELTGVASRQEELLDAFGACQSGRCTCPTDEFKKIAGMDVASTDDEIVLRLAAKPGARFDADEISACLDYTVSKIERA